MLSPDEDSDVFMPFEAWHVLLIKQTLFDFLSGNIFFQCLRWENLRLLLSGILLLRIQDIASSDSLPTLKNYRLASLNPGMDLGRCDCLPYCITSKDVRSCNLPKIGFFSEGYREILPPQAMALGVSAGITCRYEDIQLLLWSKGTPLHPASVPSLLSSMAVELHLLMNSDPRRRAEHLMCRRKGPDPISS